MTTLETLKAARDKIADVKNWTRGCEARDRASNAVSPHSPRACRWCAYGAIQSLSRGHGFAVSRLAMEIPWGGDIGTYNDTHTHAEVLALFDKAIASLEAV